MYKPRPNAFAQRYHRMVTGPLYKVVVIVVAFVAMYARDLCLALLPKQWDGVVLDGVLSFVLLFQFIEWALYSISHFNYFLTFLFWFELAGTATVLFDVPMVSGHAVYDSSNEEQFAVLRTARMLKLLRFVHVLKLLTRNELETQPGSAMDVLLRSLRKMGMPKTSVDRHRETRKESEELFGGDKLLNVLQPASMSSLVGDGLTQKLILGVLFKFMMLPLFDVGSADFYFAAKFQLESIDQFHSEHAAAIEAADPLYFNDYEHLIDRFHTENTNAVYLSVADGARIEIDRSDVIESLRDIEQRHLFSGGSVAILNVQADLRTESLLNMAMTSYLLVIFSIGYTVVIRSNFRLHLVAPQRFLLKATEVLSDIIFNHIQRSKQPVDFERHSLLQSIHSTNTAIFFSHQYPREFLRELEHPPMDDDDDDDDENGEGDDDYGVDREHPERDSIDTVTSHHGIQIDADAYESLQRDHGARRPSDWSRESIPDWLLQRYLGNSGAHYDIVIANE